MRVLLRDDDRHRPIPLRQALIDGGHTLVAQRTATDDLAAAVALQRPDRIVIDADTPHADTLQTLQRIAREWPCPVMLLVRRGDAEAARRAMRAGVCVYVVGGAPASRLASLLEIAVARFDEHQTLRRELDET